MHDLVITPKDKGKRLDACLAACGLGISRSYVHRLILAGSVLVNNRSSKPSYKLKLDDRVLIDIPPPQKIKVEPEKIDLNIIYEDKDLIVVNKPPGMVCHPAVGNYSGTLVNALLWHCPKLEGIGGKLRPGIVHRLDKDTSGLMVVAKNDLAQQSLSSQFKDHTAGRTYLALVHGKTAKDNFEASTYYGRHPKNRKKMSVLTKRAGAKQAITRFIVNKRYAKYTLLEASLLTGRTHQIRVHLTYLGYSVVGDQTYGRRQNDLEIKRQLLHAYKLSFVHPRTGKKVNFRAPLPLDFSIVLKKIEK